MQLLFFCLAFSNNIVSQNQINKVHLFNYIQDITIYSLLYSSRFCFICVVLKTQDDLLGKSGRKCV